MIDKEIIKIASNTENNGVLDNHTHSSKLKNAICGDEIKVYLIIQDNKILDFKYECESCIYCQASVSLLSKNAKNKSIEKVKKFTEQAINIFEKNENFVNSTTKPYTLMNVFKTLKQHFNYKKRIST